MRAMSMRIEIVDGGEEILNRRVHGEGWGFLVRRQVPGFRPRTWQNTHSQHRVTTKPSGAKSRIPNSAATRGRAQQLSLAALNGLTARTKALITLPSPW